MGDGLEAGRQTYIAPHNEAVTFDETCLQKEGKIMQPDLFQNEDRLFESLCDLNWLRQGFYAVRRNKGAAGIDGVSVSELRETLGRRAKRAGKRT